MHFRRALTHTISRRNQATAMTKPALRFTYNEGRVEIGKHFEINKDLSLPGAFGLFTTLPMAVFDVLVLAGAK